MTSTLQRPFSVRNKSSLLKGQRRHAPSELPQGAPQNGPSPSPSANTAGLTGFHKRSRVYGQSVAKTGVKKSRFSLRTQAAQNTPTLPLHVDSAMLRQLVQQEVAKALAAIAVPPGRALAAARERGASYARKEWDKPENLTLAAAGAYAGRSGRVINQDRNAGRYYALVLEGNSRGFRYPAWQFTASAPRLASVLGILLGAQLNCWVIHAFLTAPHAQLEGLSPSAVIADASRDLEPVLALARARFCSDQGAG